MHKSHGEVERSARLGRTCGLRPRAPSQAIIAHCRAHLADFKVPQYVALREAPLPRNPGGKVLKGELREHTQRGEALRWATHRGPAARRRYVIANPLLSLYKNEHNTPRRSTCRGLRPCREPSRRMSWA